MSTEPSQLLPNPPFYTIPNINNLRDASLSLTTTSGSRIRPHILFRSAEVSKLDVAGWTAVHSLGISHVFDLRSKPEVDKGWAGIVGKDASGDDDVRPGWLQAMEQAGVARSWVPVFEESDYSPERLAERYSKYMHEAVTGFVEAYRDILANGGPAFGTILRYLAAISPPSSSSSSAAAEDDDKVGALVHCTAGKDRTGIFFGLLFEFLRVPREQIADEYQLTELGLAHIREEVVARLMQSPGFKKYMLASMDGTKLSVEDIARSLKGEEGQDRVQVSPEVLEKGRQAALRMIGARRESMLKSLEMLDEEFGGAERYLREKCGLSGQELDALRRNLLVE
ncbi:hypothetical protein COCCADRAFT_109175 [Bipolaris zeicola 26-R-13]|uniref:Tyrosine specific protein phosphatases domain-containing protein n=1 Tax=Cochliobolus carbonum (strain 26-R-13) TaxID=930089 RepID=W6Y0B9_COCC2|nr:uncharacterized protein COCCADRAFT_109175 [Bipolaris zeicola 26-R-13]EUC28439.1 hypothetical protein COCCADRAFT_109175 [Bipolaris zeicola 26-R-13]